MPRDVLRLFMEFVATQMPDGLQVILSIGTNVPMFADVGAFSVIWSSVCASRSEGQKVLYVYVYVYVYTTI